MFRTFLISVAAALMAGSAMAQPAPVTRTYGSPTAPIAATVTVPSGYETIYLSGMTPMPVTAAVPNGAPATWGNTEQQTTSALDRIEAALRAQDLSFGDVVMMHVFLVGDPAQGGRMDFAGMMAAYTRRFGTATQPNRPARSTVQVSALVAPGMLVEIEVIAVRPARATARPAS